MKPQFGLVFAAIFAIVPLPGQQVGRQAHLIPLTAAQSRAASQKIVADKSGTAAIPDVDAGQSFILRAPGTQDVVLVPGVETVAPPQDANVIQQQCGLFQMDAAGKAVYLPVVGPDFKPYSWCEEFKGLGLAADSGPKPRLIAVYSLRSAAGNHYDMPFVLAWPPDGSRYKVDYATSFWLVRQPSGSTIAGARSLLRRKR